MKKFFQFAAAIILVAGSSYLSGCAAAGVGSCSPRADNPHESTGMKKQGKPGWMDAKGSVTCNVALQHLEGTVKMQKLISGSWKDVPGTQHTRSEQNTTANKQYVIMTAPFRCQKGRFRSAVRGKGVLKGRGSASIKWQYGNVVDNPCHIR